jgi:hypothetical protein
MIKNIIKNLVGQASNIIDEVVTTKEEKLKLKNEFEKIIQDHEKDMFAIEVKDRDSARTMFMDDSFIQKILAIIFTCAYFLISYFMFKCFIINTLELSDFFFGGSSKSK